MKASKVRRGTRVLVDDSYLEVVRVNPTQHPKGYIQFRFLNGRSILVSPDQDVETWEEK